MIVEQLFEIIDISNLANKLNQLIFYIKLDICNNSLTSRSLKLTIRFSLLLFSLSHFLYFILSFILLFFILDLDRKCDVMSHVTELSKSQSHNLSQTSFSLYHYNHWTNFHKLSWAGKPQIRAICTYAGCTKATTND